MEAIRVLVCFWNKTISTLLRGLAVPAERSCSFLLGYRMEGWGWLCWGWACGSLFRQPLAISISLCCAPLPPCRWLYPPVVFSALPETIWLFSQNGKPWRVTAFTLQARKGCSVLSIPGQKITQWWNFCLAETQGSVPVFPLLVTFTFPTQEGKHLFVLTPSFISWSFV